MAKKYPYRKKISYEGQTKDFKANTRKELEENIINWKRDIDDGKSKLTKNTLVKDWVDQYLEVYRLPSVGADQARDLKSQARVWITPFLGNKSMRDVLPLHCQKILNAMTGKSKTHIEKVRQLLIALFECAIDNNMIYKNPARKVKPPKATSGKRRAITDVEREILLEVCETNDNGLWALTMMHCGPRPCETAYIKAKHVDLKEMLLFIDGTKSEAAERFVPIPNVLRDKFKAALAKTTSPEDYLFKNNAGHQIKAWSRRWMWKSIKRQINIAKGVSVINNQLQEPLWTAEDFVAYCLRHTYATDLQKAGVPINVAKYLLGHADISTTGNIYTHDSKEAIEAARELIDKFCRPKVIRLKDKRRSAKNRKA